MRILDALANGTPVEVADFGTFTVRTYEGYEGRNPRTGERIAVPAKRMAVFTSADALRERLNDPNARALAIDVPALATLVANLLAAPAGVWHAWDEIGFVRKVEKEARPGRDPQTGEEMTIPARTVVSFHASHVLRAAIDGRPRSSEIPADDVARLLATYPNDGTTATVERLVDEVCAMAGERVLSSDDAISVLAYAHRIAPQGESILGSLPV